VRYKFAVAAGMILFVILLIPGFLVSAIVRLKLRTWRLQPAKIGRLQRWLANLYFRDRCSWKWVSRIAEAVRQENLRRAEADNMRLEAAMRAGHFVVEGGLEMWQFTVPPRPGDKKATSKTFMVPTKPIIPVGDEL
jgi:hypothetical protein